VLLWTRASVWALAGDAHLLAVRAAADRRRMLGGRKI
jgi:hypothetical protein